MQPRPIAETIGPPRPNFRCFILFGIRLSASSRSRNRQVMALQKFSIHRCPDVEIQFSRRATFVAENPLPNATHRFCRRALDGRDAEDAHESDECVRYINGIRPGSSYLLSERRDIRSWPHARAMKLRSFFVDAPDGDRSFLRSCLIASAISPRRA